VRLGLGLAVRLTLLAHPALAQQVSIDLAAAGESLARPVGAASAPGHGALSIVPGLAVMVTCFPFIVTVLSILRQAIGLQQAPPNMLIVSLALFLTWFVMDPVLTEAWTKGVEPMTNGTDRRAGGRACRPPSRRSGLHGGAGRRPRPCRRCRTCGPTDRVTPARRAAFGAGAVSSCCRNPARLRDRLSDLPALPDHRPRGRRS
jgi:hypothetical protein